MGRDQAHNQVMSINDLIPDITLTVALDRVNGNQAELARLLGYSRAYVNELVKSGHKLLPKNAALRYARRFGDE